MSYLRELIEHGIMLVSCNKDVLRLSVGESIELLIHSICSSDSREITVETDCEGIQHVDSHLSCGDMIASWKQNDCLHMKHQQ